IDGAATWEPLPPAVAPPLRLMAALPPGGAESGFIGVGAAQVDGRAVAAIVQSEDGGTSWQPVGALGAAEPGWSFEVSALAVSPAYWQDRTIFVRAVETRAGGRSTTRVWRSTDGGRSWAIWFEAADVASLTLPASVLVPPSYPRDGTV